MRTRALRYFALALLLSGCGLGASGIAAILSAVFVGGAAGVTYYESTLPTPTPTATATPAPSATPTATP